MRLFHYTTQSKLVSILESGVLLPTNEFKVTPSPTRKRIKAPIWLSSNEQMELAAIKPALQGGVIVKFSVEEFTKKFGLYRIEVKPSSKTISFNRLVRLMGLPSSEAKDLEDAAIKGGCKPSEEWYGIIGTLKVDNFIGIEKYQDGKWVSLGK